MFRSEKAYLPLPQAELEGQSPSDVRPQRPARILIPLVAGLTMSLCGNAYYMSQQYFPSMQSADSLAPATSVAELPRNISIPYTHESIWMKDSAASNDAWNAVSVDNGIVALSDEFAAEHGLKSAQRFPWDTSKGIYVLNAFHSLHCLKLIHQSLIAFQYDGEQPRPLSHILHCVDSLRQDVICDADDTPRYTTSTQDTQTGRDQPRQCRDWDRLEAWGRANSACFSYVHETDRSFPNLDRFGYCPDESPYKQTAEQYFRKYPSKWKPGAKTSKPWAEEKSKQETAASRALSKGEKMDPGYVLGSVLKREGEVAAPGFVLGSVLRRHAQPEATAAAAAGSILP